MFKYTGIGARNTPPDVLDDMQRIASNLELTGFTLRSGGAAGADSAFENGVEFDEHMEIYLPWYQFNHNKSDLHIITEDALAMAEEHHPAWHRCSPAAKKFHARNCYQILGATLDYPSDFVLCWTPNGQIEGGTGQALRIAQHHAVPVFNMQHDRWYERFHDWMKWWLEQPADFNFEEEQGGEL
jgi:hypothetical protein